MSSVSALRMFQASSMSCICRLPLRVLPTTTNSATTRQMSTQNMPRKKGPYLPKKKRPTKREALRLRPPVLTKLSDVNIIESRKKYGGGSKQKAISMATSNYTLASKNISDECRIVDVVRAFRGPKHVDGVKILQQGYAVEIDASPLQEQAGITTDDLLEGCDLSGVSPDVLQRFHDTVNAGRAYAQIESSPGQVGNCNGVLLEGDRLTQLLNDLSLEAAEQS